MMTEAIVFVSGIALGSIVTMVILLVAMATDEIREARVDDHRLYGKLEAIKTDDGKGIFTAI